MTHRYRHRPALSRQVLWALVAMGALATQAPANDGAAAATNRSGRGSCMYGPEGKLVFSPRGMNCPAFAAPPANIALDDDLVPRKPAPPAAVSAAPAPSVSLPATTRAQLQALLVERARLDAELARLREAAAYEDREAARRVTDASLAKIARHLDNETRAIQPLLSSAP
jgi:hypothetical protein